MSVCIPHDIISTKILIRLPAEVLVSFKCVCKLWRESINDPYFVKAHLIRWRSLPRPGAIKVYKPGTLCFLREDPNRNIVLRMHDSFKECRVYPKASCDGLVFIHCRPDGKIYPTNLFGPKVSSIYYICNPLTRYFMMLPSPPIDENKYNKCFILYDDIINQYKIVVRTFGGSNFLRCYVLSLDAWNGSCTGQWKTFLVPNFVPMVSKPALLGGCMHWIVEGKLEYLALATISYSRKLARIEDGEVREIELPNQGKNTGAMALNLRLIVIKEDLYLVNFHNAQHCYIIWILEDWDKQIWTKLYEKKHEQCSKWSLHKCNEELFRYCWDIIDGDSVINEIKLQVRNSLFWYGLAHFNSLVDLGEIERPFAG